MCQYSRLLFIWTPKNQHWYRVTEPYWAYKHVLYVFSKICLIYLLPYTVSDYEIHLKFLCIHVEMDVYFLHLIKRSPQFKIILCVQWIDLQMRFHNICSHIIWSRLLFQFPVFSSMHQVSFSCLTSVGQFQPRAKQTFQNLGFNGIFDENKQQKSQSSCRTQ